MKIEQLVGRAVVIREINFDSVIVESIESGGGPGVPQLYAFVADDFESATGSGSITVYELKPTELK